MRPANRSVCGPAGRESAVHNRATTRCTFRHKVRADSDQAAREAAFSVTLDGVLDESAVPEMYATGDADRIIAQ